MNTITMNTEHYLLVIPKDKEKRILMTNKCIIKINDNVCLSDEYLDLICVEYVNSYFSLSRSN